MFCTINNLLCRHFREEQKNLDKQNWNKIGVLQKKLKKWERLPFQGIKLIILVVFIRVGWGGGAKSKPWLAAKQKKNYKMQKCCSRVCTQNAQSVQSPRSLSWKPACWVLSIEKKIQSTLDSTQLCHNHTSSGLITWGL